MSDELPIDQTRYPPPRDDAAIIKGYLERITYLEELNRRLERYANFSADGIMVWTAGRVLVIECNNCHAHHEMTREKYEELVRVTAERKGRVDL